MMLRHIVSAAALAFGVINPAHAERLLPFVYNIQNGDVYAVDLDTIREVNGFRRAWILMGFVKSTTNDRSVAFHSLVEFDCDLGRDHRLSANVYEEDGSYRNQLKEASWDYVAPGTRVYDEMKIVCNKGLSAEAKTFDDTAIEFYKRFVAVFKKSQK